MKKVAGHKIGRSIEGLNAYCVCTKVILAKYDITETFLNNLTTAVKQMNVSGIYLLDQDFTTGITGSFEKEKFKDNLIEKEGFLFESQEQIYHQAN